MKFSKTMERKKIKKKFYLKVKIFKCNIENGVIKFNDVKKEIKSHSNKCQK